VKRLCTLKLPFNVHRLIVKMRSHTQTSHNPVAHKDSYSRSNTTVSMLLLGSFIHVAYLWNNYVFRCFF
jgi:hypothetical protein